MREGRALFTNTGDRANPITPDGSQIDINNIYAATGLLPRGDGQSSQPETGQPGADTGVQAKEATLFSNSATDEQKLSAVRDLAKSGITSLSYHDASGAEHNLRLELEPAGKRQMVHLFESGADGKEHTILRGISNPDGTFEQERNRSGESVSYKGGGYSQMMSEQTGTPGDVQPGQPQATPGRPDANQRPPDAVEPPQPPTTAPELTEGAIDRSQFNAQLNDPRVMAAFAGRMATEVGSQGPAAQLAFAEEVMNRAAARHQTLMEALSGSYYPARHPGSSHNPAYIAAITTAWKEGTDTTHGATGNASGRVGFGVRGGHYDANHHWVSPNQTAYINGERFGYEQVDLDHGWLQMYAQLKQQPPVDTRTIASQPPPSEGDSWI